MKDSDDYETFEEMQERLEASLERLKERYPELFEPRRQPSRPFAVLMEELGQAFRNLREEAINTAAAIAWLALITPVDDRPFYTRWIDTVRDRVAGWRE